MSNLIRYTRGYKYQLAQPYSLAIPIYPKTDIVHPLFELTTKGQLTILYGYAWDGPSGPTRDTPSSMRGSLVHDVLYQMMRMQLLTLEWRDEADQLFWRLLQEDGMWRWRAWLWWWAVRRLAAGAASNGREVEGAP